MSCQEDQTNQVQEKCGSEKTTSENSPDNVNHGCHMRSVWDPSVVGPHLGSGDASELSLAGAIPRHFFCPHPPQTDQVSWLSHLSREAGCSSRIVDYRFQYPITNHDSPEAPVQQCLLTPNQDYMLGAQSNPCHFLNPIPSVTNSSGHHSLANNIPGTWATEATMHCGITSGELYDAVVSICPESMIGHGCDDSRNELATHNLMEINQPATGPLTVYLQPLEQPGDSKTMLCNLGAGGQVVVVNHCSPGSSLGLPSAFRTDSTQAHTLLTPSQLLAPAPGPPMSSGYSYSHLPPPYYAQYHKPACPLYPEARANAADSQPKGPVRLGGMIWDSKSKKPCNCTKSQCLKLYCDCFANGEVCSNCNCVNCYNNAEHEGDRYKAIKICLDRNPEAFRPKIGSGKSGEVKGRHNKGCNCKRSGCLKNYCECYEAKIMCSSTCKCVGCRNYEDSPERRTVEWDSPDTTFYKKANCQKDKCPLSCITLDVVEATCGCLLAQAEEAEREAHSLAHAERMILEEFGQCLTQIVRSIFKSTGL